MSIHANVEKLHNPLQHDTPCEDEARLEKTFKTLDLDGNGKIDIHDLSIALKGAGVNEVYAKVSSWQVVEDKTILECDISNC